MLNVIINILDVKCQYIINKLKIKKYKNNIPILIINIKKNV